MNPTRVNAVLAALLAIVLALVLVRPDATRPNWEVFPAMKRSPAVHAFEANPHFANGRALQAAVAGTIARGRLPLHFTASKEEAVRAGEELRNPYQQPRAAAEPELAAPNSQAKLAAVDSQAALATADPLAELAASAQRGESAYRIYCQSCHGATGAGDGPVAQRGFPPPPPLGTGKSTQMKDGQLFHILTYGQGSMASMAAQLDRGQRWDVVNFVRSLQAKAAQTAAPEAAQVAPSSAPPSGSAPSSTEPAATTPIPAPATSIAPSASPPAQP